MPTKANLITELFGDGATWNDLTRRQQLEYHKIWKRRWKLAHPDKHRRHNERRQSRVRARKAADPEYARQQSEYNKRWRAKNTERLPNYYRKYRLKVEYNLTTEQYSAMLAAQNGKCAICGRRGKKRSDGDQRLHVDHDHTTGKVRALLCHHCNMLLGHARDRVSVIRRAADYVEAHRAGRIWVRPILELLSEEAGAEGCAEGVGTGERQRAS